MRRLIHLVFQPASRLVRLALGEKRLAVEPEMAEDTHAHMPQLVDLDGTTVTGLWAILDHIEGNYPEIPLVPDDIAERGEAFRWLDWTMTVFAEQVVRKIIWEKANPRYTGAPSRSTPNMDTIRSGRDTLRELIPFLGTTVEEHSNLVSRNCNIADLSLAAQLSSLDYFGEVPWDANVGLREWYMRMKSRPAFRALLSDRVPGQPPIKYYADLDF